MIICMETQEETLVRLEAKIDAIYKSTEKSRKYLLTMFIASILMVILPIIIGALMLPFAINTFSSMYSI